MIDSGDKYLGSPLFTIRCKFFLFKPCVDKLKYKLDGWKTKLPTSILLEDKPLSVCPVIFCIYQMNCLKLPKQTCQEINKLRGISSGEKILRILKDNFQKYRIPFGNQKS